MVSVDQSCARGIAQNGGQGITAFSGNAHCIGAVILGQAACNRNSVRSNNRKYITACELAIDRFRARGEQTGPAFECLYRSGIVNATAIDTVSRDFRGQASVKIKGRPETLVVSRPFSHLFKQM